MRHLGGIDFGPRMRIERYRFDNGLSLLVQPDRRAPVASYQTWFRVGSRHERPGKTGIAHLFEHLMFGGTKSRPHGQLDRILEEAGVDNNAATYLDWTFYVDSLPSEALELVAELESDRMANLVLEEGALEREREVVLNERRETVDDDVDGAISEALHLEAFERHGYRHPTIGFAEDIAGLTLEDCRAFYASHYAPNNATIVIAGDVDPEAAARLVEKHYGHMEPGRLIAEDDRPEPPRDGERRRLLEMPTDSAQLVMGYPAPAMGDPDHPAVVVLSEILFGGRGSRMHRRLVEERELASEVDAYAGFFRDPCLWEMQAVARDDAELEAVAEAFDAVIDEVRRAPVTDAELARACARIELSTLQGIVGVTGRAEQIGFCETVLADPAVLFERLARYRALEPGDLRAAAERYLAPERRTVIEVVPDEGDDEEEDEA
jgi:zinc protease